MEKKKIILPTKKFFKSDEEDLTIRINLNETENLMREGDRNIILDISELFDEERNKSNNYKIYGKLKMVFRNLYTGTTTYNPLLKKLYLETNDLENPIGTLPYNEFAFLRNDVVREVNTPSSGTTLDSFQTNITLSEIPEHTLITPINSPYHNWNIYLSYIYGQDENFPMKYTLSGNTTFSFTAKDGIPFRVSDNGNYITLTSPVEHGINTGEYVTLSTTGNTYYDSSGITTDIFYRTFPVEYVGNEVHNSEKFVINIAKSNFISGTTLSTVVFGKRVIDKNRIQLTTSKYYVHKHKTLTKNSDYILDKAGFESPIWEEEKTLLFENTAGDTDVLIEKNRMESLLYDFKEPFILSNITNNLGYTPTEVYLSVIFKNGNGYFDYPPKVGYKFHFHNKWVDNHFKETSTIETGITSTTLSTNTTGYSFTGGTELPVGTILTGAFVDYNEYEMKERIVSESFHKITSRTDIFNHGQTTGNPNFLGISETNPSGLYYQPHYRVPLRQLSPYVESFNTNDIYNLPENARFFSEEGQWRWRDLYDPGFIDIDGYGLNYPFVNNIHYVKKDFNFYLRNEEYYQNKSDGITSFNNNGIKGKNTKDC